jgi:hypothetical protein
MQDAGAALLGTNDMGDLADPHAVFIEQPLMATIPGAFVAAEHPQLSFHITQGFLAVLLVARLPPLSSLPIPRSGSVAAASSLCRCSGSRPQAG